MKKISLFLSISLVCQCACGFSYGDCAQSVLDYIVKKPALCAYSHMFKPLGIIFMSLDWKAQSSVVAACAGASTVAGVAGYYAFWPLCAVTMKRDYKKLCCLYTRYYCAYKQVLAYLKKIDNGSYELHSAYPYFSALSNDERQKILDCGKDSLVDYDTGDVIRWGSFGTRVSVGTSSIPRIVYFFDYLPEDDPNYYLFLDVGNLKGAIGDTFFNALSDDQKKKAKAILENHLIKLRSRLYMYYWALSMVFVAKKAFDFTCLAKS